MLEALQRGRNTCRPRALRALRALRVLLLLAGPAACAPKIVPAPVITTPKFPEFIQPTVPAALGGTRAAESQRRGWTFLQAGGLKTAEHEFSPPPKSLPPFFPAEAPPGFNQLAPEDAKAPLGQFDPPPE